MFSLRLQYMRGSSELVHAETNLSLRLSSHSLLYQVEGGADHSPQLSWDAGPEGTKSYVENWKHLLRPFKTLVDALPPSRIYTHSLLDEG